jgi:hypothetical protein
MSKLKFKKKDYIDKNKITKITKIIKINSYNKFPQCLKSIEVFL